MDSVSIVTHSDGKKQLIYAPRIVKGDGVGEISEKELQDITITPTKLSMEDVKDWTLDKVNEFLYGKN